MIPHQREENYNLLLCGQHQKVHNPKEHKDPALSILPACRRVQSPLSKSWNPSSCTEWSSTTLQLSGGLPPKVHRGPTFPTVPDSGQTPTATSKSKNAGFPTERRKNVTCYSVGGPRAQRSTGPEHSVGSFHGAQRSSTSQCTFLQESSISPV
jgi:hypothetical protein